MTKRAQELYDKARKALTGPANDELLRALAVMVDAALPAKKAYTPNADGKVNFVAGTEVLSRLKYTAPEAVTWEPTPKGAVVMAGASARDAKLTPEDIELLAAWLRDGGLDWMRDKPTFNYVARNLVDLVARARGHQPYSKVTTDDALDRLREQRDL